MKLKQNDTVLIISGKDKGKTGKIMRVIRKENKIVVENINMHTKHIRKSQKGPGEKITLEAPLYASKVMIIDPKTNKPTRIHYKILENGKKVRVSALSGTSLDEIKNNNSISIKKPKGKESKKQVVKA